MVRKKFAEKPLGDDLMKKLIFLAVVVMSTGNAFGQGVSVPASATPPVTSTPPTPTTTVATVDPMAAAQAAAIANMEVRIADLYTSLASLSGDDLEKAIDQIQRLEASLVRLKTSAGILAADASADATFRFAPMALPVHVDDEGVVSSGYNSPVVYKSSGVDVKINDVAPFQLMLTAQLAGKSDAATLMAHAAARQPCCTPVPVCQTPVPAAPVPCSRVTLCASNWGCVRPYGRTGFYATYQGTKYVWVRTIRKTTLTSSNLHGRIEWCNAANSWKFIDNLVDEYGRHREFIAYPVP